MRFPVDPLLLGYGDSEPFLGVEDASFLIIDLCVESSELKAVTDIVFDWGRGAEKPLEVMPDGVGMNVLKVFF